MAPTQTPFIGLYSEKKFDAAPALASAKNDSAPCGSGPDFGSATLKNAAT
jgi:hypothetical protein